MEEYPSLVKVKEDANKDKLWYKMKSGKITTVFVPKNLPEYSSPLVLAINSFIAQDPQCNIVFSTKDGGRDDNSFPEASYSIILDLLKSARPLELKKEIGGHALDKVAGHLKHYIAYILIR